MVVGLCRFRRVLETISIQRNTVLTGYCWISGAVLLETPTQSVISTAAHSMRKGERSRCTSPSRRVPSRTACLPHLLRTTREAELSKVHRLITHIIGVGPGFKIPKPDLLLNFFYPSLPWSKTPSERTTDTDCHVLTYMYIYISAIILAYTIIGTIFSATSRVCTPHLAFWLARTP